MLRVQQRVFLVGVPSGVSISASRQRFVSKRSWVRHGVRTSSYTSSRPLVCFWLGHLESCGRVAPRAPVGSFVGCLVPVALFDGLAYLRTAVELLGHHRPVLLCAGFLRRQFTHTRADTFGCRAELAPKSSVSAVVMLNPRTQLHQGDFVWDVGYRKQILRSSSRHAPRRNRPLSHSGLLEAFPDSEDSKSGSH